MSKKESTYAIKVPVFTTEIIERPNDIFGGITIQHMKDYVVSKAEAYNKQESHIKLENRIKTKQTIIRKIDCHFNESIRDAILLQVSAYTTNHYDGYLESEEKTNFSRTDKVGSDTNFILIYPVLTGLSSTTYSHHFLALVYDDPTKSDSDLLKIARLVLNKILLTPIVNIKLESVLDELRQVGEIPELQMKYTALSFDDNDVDIHYREYLVDRRLSKTKYQKFKDMPIKKVEEIIGASNEDGYQKREAKLTVGKKEYKILREIIDEATEELNLTVEKIFNARKVISAEVLETIHDIPYIFEVINPILTDYLTNGDNA